MKKRIAIFLLAVMLIGCLCACAESAITKPVTVEGAIFGGMSDDKIRTSLTFDTKWLTKEKNSRYNPKLAQFCALLSSDAYFREKDYEKQRQNRVVFDELNEAEYDFTTFLTNLGFTETAHYESYLMQESPIDSNDSVTLTIGHQTVDGKYDVYAAVIRGCFSAQEWCSAFDPGCADDAYTALTGEHPEWVNGEHFKGIDVAASRALAFIDAFMKDNGDEKLPDRLLLTGHSRGGGVANLLGAHYEAEDGVTSYTYTFNSPGVTFAADAAAYQTIFNVFDSSDFFTDAFPFAAGTFARYGTDMTMPGAEVGEAIAALKGRDDYACISADAAEEYRTLFAERFPSRDGLCEQVSITRSYENAADAEAGREELLTLIGSEAGLGLDDLCTVGEAVKETDGSYSVTLTYCGAALLRTYAKVMAYGEAAYDGAVSLFAEDELGCQIATVLFENAAGINGGHLLVNSYVIAGSVK